VNGLKNSVISFKKPEVTGLAGYFLIFTKGLMGIFGNSETLYSPEKSATN